MFKLISILLSTLVLLQSARLDLADIVQFDELIEHARFHSEKYGDNFLVFLSKHYGELQQDHQQQHQEEQDEHKDLPFGHQSCQHAMAPFVLLGKSYPLLKASPSAPIAGQFHYQETYSSFEKFDIFQPPRYA